jgi:hypothetical protein
MSTMESTKWLLSATDHKSQNDKYHHVYGNVATDGYRLHVDKSMPVMPKESMPYDFDTILDPIYSYTDHIEINAAALIVMVKAAKALDVNILKIKVSRMLDGNNQYMLLSIIANDKNNNIDFEVSRMIENHSVCSDFTIGINPRFLLDALLGLTCETNVTMHVSSYTPERKPIHLHCSDRDAVIMPMQLQ